MTIMMRKKEEIKKAENFNETEIDTFRHMTPYDFNDTLIHDYLKCSKLNHDLNESKATKLKLLTIKSFCLEPYVFS